ncbi:hypothetical protein [Paenibacillus wynnii]|nr:hypothetical protein [Paenibacillus wynnii]
MEQARRELQRLQDQTRRAADQEELQAAYTKTGVVGAAAFAMIVAAIMKGVSAYNESTNAMLGLKSIAENTGNSVSGLQKAMAQLTSDGLMPVSNAATGLKNLLSRGFGLEEAVDIMNRFKDSAAFGRQASLTFGYAIQSATEGLKNENSILVDNAGVTKNVSVMWKEYAKELGKSYMELTLAEKRQAEYNGIMKETQHQLGNAALYTQTFSGQQAALGASTLVLAQNFGASLIPVLSVLVGVIKPVIDTIGIFVKDNPEAVAAITTLGATFTGLIAVFGAATEAAKLAMIGLVTNPVILILAGVAAAFAAVTVAIHNNRVATEELEKAQDDLQRV